MRELVFECVFCCRVISDILAMLQIHLFDIDIPGKITFIESKTLTAGETPTIVDTGPMCSLISHSNSFSVSVLMLIYILVMFGVM